MSPLPLILLAVAACFTIVIYAFVLEFVLGPSRKPWRWERRGPDRRMGDRRHSNSAAPYSGPERRQGDRRVVQRRAVAAGA